MNIVHVNLFAKSGGAAQIANALMDHMRNKGHRVHQFVFFTENISDEYTIPIEKWLSEGEKSLLQQGEQKKVPNLLSPYLMKILQHPIFMTADLVHLHCVNGEYFSYLLLPFLAGKRLIWTFHDTLAFTAQCLQPHFCNHWQIQYCGDCPLEKQGAIQWDREQFQKIKEQMIQLTEMEIVAPSLWIANMVKQSIFKNKKLQCIYNGVDTDLFQPLDKRAVRKSLNLPDDVFILMFAAHGGLGNKMKGGDYFISVLKNLQKKYPHILFLHVGSADNTVPEGIHLKTITYPYIDNPSFMNKLYAAADLFVSTSLSESFGLTVCEAMASGTPVVAFAAGGIREIVGEDKQSGCLISLGDTRQMEKAIEEAIENKVYLVNIGLHASQRIEKSFSKKLMCNRYEKLYHEYRC